MPFLQSLSMNKLILILGVISLFLYTACEKEEPLSPEAEAMKLLITNDINAIDDLMHFKVYSSQLESIFQGWNSDDQEGITFIDIELREKGIFAAHHLFDEVLEEWDENTIDIAYEEIDNYIIQNNKLVDGASGIILREGNNIVIYLKEVAN